MVYTEAEKNKIDNILKAFSGFIKEQDYFDIVYSEKMGYIKLLVEMESEPASALATAGEMLDTLCDEFIAETVFSPQNPSHRLTEEAKTESRSRLMAIIAQIEEDREYYLDYVTRYIQECYDKYDND